MRHRSHDTTRSRAGRRPAAFAAGLVLAIALALAATAPAQAAGLLIADGGLGGRLEIEEHAVEVTINNGIAVTTVNQVFRNLENRQVEALYTFPVPRGASVANFSMWIGGKEMIGEVVEKERARRIYDSYKQVRRDPGLLEQTDYKTFEMRIFPIEPRAEQRVRISYYQELDFDANRATYVYPLATTTAAAVDSRTRGRFALTLDVASEVPIVALDSPSHGDDFAIARHTPGYVQASLETTGGDLGRDVVLSYELSRARTGLDLVASMEPREDGYFMLTLTAGDELGDPDAAGMDYVFVLDVSGSMNDDGKLGLSRNSIGAFVEALGPEDRFEVLAFNVTATTLFRELRPADDDARQRAAAFLGEQRARGGTVLEPALRAAYGFKNADRPLNVVILSDGMTEQRERQTLIRLIGERPPATRVFAVGVGNDVNRPLLEQLAEDAGGLAAFISRGDDFERQARAFRRKLVRPVASDLRIEIDGGGVYDVEPRQLPDLYHGAPVRMYGRYEKPGSVRLTIDGTLGGQAFQKVFDIELPGEDADNPEIERMWAWHRIERLQRDADRAGERQDVVDEVVRLGEAFSIVTEYTSFLVLENDAEYARWKIERRNALRIERDRASRERVHAKLAALRAAAADVGPATATRADARRPAPTPATPASSPPPPPSNSSNSPSSSSRGWDLDAGGRSGGGGGAFDPLTVGLVATLGGLAAASWRRRRPGA